MSVRTRMAPSPTGEYHIGGMRTLLYNYAFAKKEGGQFILRVEDTDRERLVPGATERLIAVIKEYGLTWDEGPEVGGPHMPYIQSERLEIYQKYAKQLIESGHAYYCFCTKERLENLREEQKQKGFPSTRYDKNCLHLTKEEITSKLKANEPFVIRLNVPENQEVTFNDKILGVITFPTKDIDDQVLIKSDGFPTYHLAVVVDDYLMGINFVMRGMEWLPSTPKHILLYKAFGWDLPAYGHLPLLKEIGDTKKLSKRMGSVAASEFLNEGYLPEALLNFLMFLGWNPGTEKEIYSLEEFINDFTIERIQKTDLVAFDRQKLEWYNGYYVRNLTQEELWEKLQYWLQKYQKFPEYKLDKSYSLRVLKLVQDRMKVLSDFLPLTKYFYVGNMCNYETYLSYVDSKLRASEILTQFEKLLSEIGVMEWTSLNLDSKSHEMIKEFGYKPKEAFMSLRIAVTGEIATPPIFEVLELIGKDTSILRIKDAINSLR